MTGTELKDKLLAEGFKVLEIAGKLGISEEALYSKLKTKDVKITLLKSIAKATNKSLSFWLDDKNIPHVEETQASYGPGFSTMLAQLVQAAADTALAAKYSAEAAKYSAEASKDCSATNKDLVRMVAEGKRNGEAAVIEARLSSRIQELHDSLAAFQQTVQHQQQSVRVSKEQPLKEGLKEIERLHKERHSGNADAKGSQGT